MQLHERRICRDGDGTIYAECGKCGVLAEPSFQFSQKEVNPYYK